MTSGRRYFSTVDMKESQAGVLSEFQHFVEHGFQPGAASAHNLWIEFVEQVLSVLHFLISAVQVPTVEPSEYSRRRLIKIDSFRLLPLSRQIIANVAREHLRIAENPRLEFVNRKEHPKALVSNDRSLYRLARPILPLSRRRFL